MTLIGPGVVDFDWIQEKMSKFLRNESVTLDAQECERVSSS